MLFPLDLMALALPPWSTVLIYISEALFVTSLATATKFTSSLTLSSLINLDLKRAVRQRREQNKVLFMQRSHLGLSTSLTRSPLINQIYWPMTIYFRCLLILGYSRSHHCKICPVSLAHSFLTSLRGLNLALLFFVELTNRPVSV